MLALAWLATVFKLARLRVDRELYTLRMNPALYAVLCVQVSIRLEALAFAVGS